MSTQFSFAEAIPYDATTNSVEGAPTSFVGVINDGDEVLTVGQAVTLEFSGSPNIVSTFVGIANINGTAFPVVTNGNDAILVPSSADTSGFGTATPIGSVARDYNLDGSTPPPPVFLANWTVSIGSTFAGIYGGTVPATVPVALTSIDDDFDVGETFLVGPGGGAVTLTYVGSVMENGQTGQVFDQTGGARFALFESDPGDLTGQTANITGSENPICFAAGTLIATPTGERCVKDLSIGDPVLTADGRRLPVKWIGRQTVLARFAGDRARPVRVAAGALGDGLPHRDLVLTADHALILDGYAVNAGALVNGTTIALDPAPERAIYYHVETEAHEVILANGAPAETYVPYVARRAFDNFAEYTALYGPDLDIAEMPLPRIATARMLPGGLRRRLAAQLAV